MRFIKKLDRIIQKARRKLRLALLDPQTHIMPMVELEKLQEFLGAVRPKKTNHLLIRIGGEGDGGYLVPDDLGGINSCFSPGVSFVADFELALAQGGVQCFLADYSVDAPPVSNRLFDFEKKFLGPKATDIFMTLESWVRRKAANDSDLILQMDIEGSEYGVLCDTGSDVLKQFRILVIEFHDLDLLLDRAGFELINLTFTKILKDFEVVHIHPNNCSKVVEYGGIKIPPVIEITFLRKDRITSSEWALEFPHPLDRINVPRNLDIPLPKCWYGAA